MKLVAARIVANIISNGSLNQIVKLSKENDLLGGLVATVKQAQDPNVVLNILRGIELFLELSTYAKSRLALSASDLNKLQSYEGYDLFKDVLNNI